MGSTHDEFVMNVKIIGSNIEKFYELIKKSKALYTIKNYWKINYEKEVEVFKSITNYFDLLEKNKADENKTKNIRETLIVKVNSENDNEVKEIIKRMNELEETHYMPLVLFLIVNYNNTKIYIDESEYEDIDQRLIFTAEYSEDPLIIEKNIAPKLLRICSIHNELGDNIRINGKENYDLIEQYFPFNINIVCIGRFGQGKSTGVNEILQEYKAKESSKGAGQTKNLTFYQVTGKPVRILDIPGFESKKTVDEAIKKFKQAKEGLTKMKNKIHIILYFLNYLEERKFSDEEIPIIEEIINYNAKIIYVITHSTISITNKQKKKCINQINEGIQEKSKKNQNVYAQTQENGVLKASEENVVFVNFHKDKKTGSQPFGKMELFRKIHDFFILSEDYNEYLLNKDKKYNNKEFIEKEAERLREEGKHLLLSNKVWGGIVGILPIADWALQKFVIKKNAVKKLGDLFGIDTKIIEKEIEIKSNKNNNNEKELNLIEESGGEIAGNASKAIGDTTAYVGGSVAIGQGVAKGLSIAAEGAAAGGEVVAEATVAIGGTILKFVGTSLVIVGAVVGTVTGGVLMNSYCNDLLDKFVKYYKENYDKIRNSYEEIVDYFGNCPSI